MVKKRSSFKKNCMVLIVLLSVIPWNGWTQETLDFESDRWVMANAKIVEHLGRTSLMGTAYLKETDFENGVIEVDVAVTGDRSYPGLVFRMQSPLNYERFYIRPHRAPYYPDALQYTHVISGVASWQLCQGEGFTALAEIPKNKWIHLKMEISGTQARVYLDNMDHPALVIPHLKHGKSKGTIGLMGPLDKTAFFSNFRYKVDNTLEFDPPPDVDTPPGMIMEWELSQAFKADAIEMDVYPDEQIRQKIEWKRVHPEPSGLLDVCRFSQRSPGGPEVVFAMATISAKKQETKKYLFGYSDEISIFLNGKNLFTGNSAYQSRDPSFLGAVGLFDAVFLPLEKGENELLFVLKETFGGWGFMCQDGTAVFQAEGLVKLWETEKSFKIPESIVFDGGRNCFYVSNYDGYNPSNNQGKQAISKVSLDGKNVILEWASGLNNPTGMAIFGNRLYVVERQNLVEIDLDSSQIIEKHPIPQAGFLNDVAVDDSGNLYISDSSKHVIYRYSGGIVEEWIKNSEIRNPNGLHVFGGRLIVGNNGDQCLKAIDCETKKIATITNLGPGIIDGIQSDNRGNLLVSHWEGKIYLVSPEGEVEKLLDVSVPKTNTADFAYFEEKGLIVIPTFTNNQVLVYRLTDN
jgi:sugar lactone lactonase YvrE